MVKKKKKKKKKKINKNKIKKNKINKNKKLLFEKYLRKNGKSEAFAILV